MYGKRSPQASARRSTLEYLNFLNIARDFNLKKAA